MLNEDTQNRTEWILMKDKVPKERIFWGFVKGRYESEGYRAPEIQLFINSYEREEGLGDLRTLDYAQKYVVEGYSNLLADWNTIIAWMPLEKMPLPKGYNLEKKMRQ